jgi:transposase
LTSNKKRAATLTRQQFQQRLEALKGTTSDDGDILNLYAWRTRRYRETDHDLIIEAELITEITEPCACGAPPSAFQKWGPTKLAYLHDLPIRRKRTRVYYQKQRYRCTACNKTLSQPLAGADERHRLMTRLGDYIKQEGLNLFRTFADLADEVGYSEQTIRDIVTAHAVQLEKERRIDTPLWISIDEVYIEKQERCVITDPVGQRVIHMLPTNRQVELETWLLQLPNRHKVRLVTIDMWAPYLGAVQRLLPTAAIVVDRYHVHNLLNGGIKDVLGLVRNSMSYSERRQYMRDPLILLTSRFHLEDAQEDEENDEETPKKPSQVEIRDKWLEDVPDVATAYWLKESFSDILQLRDRQKAEELTDHWLRRVEEFIEELHSKYQKEKGDCPFTNVRTAIKTWRPYILNYVDSKSICSSTVTNFFAEHVNKKLKSAKSLGNGIAFETIRMKAVHGGVMVKRRPPHPLSDRQARSKVERLKKRREVNPDSNLEQLKRAREDRDETKNLRPKPQTVPGWAARFLSTSFIPAPETPPRNSGMRKDGHVIQYDAPASQGDAGAAALLSLIPDVDVHVQTPTAEGETPASEKLTVTSRRKRPKVVPNQLTMFLT